MYWWISLILCFVVPPVGIALLVLPFALNIFGIAAWLHYAGR
jgi:hypothetical protein